MSVDPTVQDVLGSARVVMWVCPVREHRRNGNRPTVAWRDGVAHCLTDGCERTSANTTRADFGFRTTDPDVVELAGLLHGADPDAVEDSWFVLGEAGQARYLAMACALGVAGHLDARSARLEWGARVVNDTGGFGHLVGQVSSLHTSRTTVAVQPDSELVVRAVGPWRRAQG